MPLSEDVLRIFVDNAPVSMAMFDTGMRYIAYSHRWLEDYGLGKRNLSGLSHYEVFPEIPDRWKEIHRRCLLGHAERCEEDSFERADGTVQYIRWEIKSWHDAAGRVGGLLFFTESITERVKAQHALQESESRFRALIDDIEVGVVLQDTQDRILLSNRVAQEMLGVSEETLRGVTSEDPRWELVRPDGTPMPQGEVPSVRAARARAAVRGALVGTRHLDTDTRRWLRVSAFPRLDEQGEVRHVLVSLIDVTAEVLAEQALRESERLHRSLHERFSMAAESAGIGVWELSLDNNELIWDEGTYRIFGYEPDEPGAPSALFYERVHPDDRSRIANEVLDCVQSPLPMDAEFRVVIPAGQVRTLKAYARVIRGEDGRPQRIVGVNHDITKQRQLEEQLLHAQKMQAIGVLAGGVAHDFNNLLTVITGYGEMVLADLEVDGQTRMRVQHMQEAGERAALLTQQLLLFSRRATLQPEVLNVNELLERMGDMLRRLIKENIDLRVSPSSVPVWILADRMQIEQVVMNLCVNARDAMPDGGILSIACDTLRFAPSDLFSYPGCKSGDYVRLTVSDTGCGMSPEVRERVFEPFFTTKPFGEGTGLGLATVYGVVQQCGGFIRVESAPGAGATFEVSLPAVSLAGAPPAAKSSAAENLRGGELVLLVEDEAQVREVLQLSLESFGYRVVTACNGIEALDVCRSNRERFDLLLTDVVMPEMGGGQLARILGSRYPEMQVIFMSGYSDDAVLELGLEDSEDIFLQKPFSPITLAKRVREVLDSRVRQPQR
ncbi:MAG: hypothetical protein RLZZ303_3530 [Candidatus Hydrogenedentota bacterium]|jgi:PAS domain S-box-containing protein